MPSYLWRGSYFWIFARSAGWDVILGGGGQFPLVHPGRWEDWVSGFPSSPDHTVGHPIAAVVDGGRAGRAHGSLHPEHDSNLSHTSAYRLWNVVSCAARLDLATLSVLAWRSKSFQAWLLYTVNLPAEPPWPPPPRAQLCAMQCRAIPFARSFTVSVLPVPAGPEGGAGRPLRWGNSRTESERRAHTSRPSEKRAGPPSWEKQ